MEADSNKLDERFMDMALRQACTAGEAGEVPIGAVIVHQDGRILGKAYNQTETLKDPTAHAEVLAITQAAAALGDWRLLNTTLYITKEPCPMCAGAIVLARIPRVVWALDDPLRGGNSQFSILDSTTLNHRPSLSSGVGQALSLDIIQTFFKERRSKSTPEANPEDYQA